MGDVTPDKFVGVGGALEVEGVEGDGVFSAVAGDVVELAAGDPIIFYSEAGAVFQIDDGVGRGRGVLCARIIGGGIIGAGIFGGRILPIAGRGLLRPAFA